MRIKFHASAGIEPTPSCLSGERLDHYATEAGTKVPATLKLKETSSLLSTNAKYLHITAKGNNLAVEQSTINDVPAKKESMALTLVSKETLEYQPGIELPCDR
ncbi:hypothetical protein M8J77_022449 [Diaphorina citri]|nr:hypothetical protein M8J77_020769 [Diaphorina citri]KAI5721570.1 hypothetical protein M8J77_022449 [Diaphorina citri]